jgi:hypothetical protein
MGVNVAIAKKEAKRKKAHWRLPERTILVLDLVDRSLIGHWPEDPVPTDELGTTGFIEVWISDHSSIETHGEVAAIGLFPKDIWGSKDRDTLGPPLTNK